METLSGISIACAVVSALSAFFNIWLAWRSRAQAGWTITQVSGAPITQLYPHLFDVLIDMGEAKMPTEVVRVTNTGDGDAFNVYISVNGGHAHIFEKFEVAEGFTSYQIIDTAYHVSPSETFLVALFDDGDKDLSITIHWTLQPTRLNKVAEITRYMRGFSPQQPVKPIVHRAEWFSPSVSRWKFEHSSFGKWLHSKTPVLEHVPFLWRTWKKSSQKKDNQ